MHSLEGYNPSPEAGLAQTGRIEFEVAFDAEVSFALFLATVIVNPCLDVKE